MYDQQEPVTTLREPPISTPYQSSISASYQEPSGISDQGYQAACVQRATPVDTPAVTSSDVASSDSDMPHVPNFRQRRVRRSETADEATNAHSPSSQPRTSVKSNTRRLCRRRRRLQSTNIVSSPFQQTAPDDSDSSPAPRLLIDSEPSLTPRSSVARSQSLAEQGVRRSYRRMRQKRPSGALLKHDSNTARASQTTSSASPDPLLGRHSVQSSVSSSKGGLELVLAVTCLTSW